MAEINNKSVDNLINYIINNEEVSIEDTKKAISGIHDNRNASDPKYKELLLKIIHLINKRTDEANEFVDVIYNRTLSKAEKNTLLNQKVPFKDGDIQVEKLIIEKIYETNRPYKTLEDMLVDLVYNIDDDPDELKAKIKAALDEIGINTDIERETEEEKDYLRSRT